MSIELDDIFKDVSAGLKINRAPTRDDIAADAKVYEAHHGVHKVFHPPDKPKKVNVVHTPLFRITEPMRRAETEKITLFPNAEQLGKEAEQVVYTLLLGTFLTQRNFEVLDKPQSYFREEAFALFGNTHRKKAFAVADLLYRKRELFADRKTPKVSVLFTAVHGSGEFQLSAPIFDAVTFHPDQTARDLTKWEQVITDTASDALSLMFEVTISARCGNRTIRHPFDVMAMDSSGDVHLIEISNRKNTPYPENPTRLVEDAFLELSADRVPLHKPWGEEIDLLGDPVRVGFGEVWTLRNEPGQRNSAIRIHLTDEEMQHAVDIMMHGEIYY